MHLRDRLAPRDLTPPGDISASDYSGRTRTKTNGRADASRESREGADMTPGYRAGTATGSGRERARSLHWLTLAAVLTILLSAVAPAVWTHGAGVARAQDEVAAGDVTLPGQVIAQGIARLPRGDLAWTVRTINVTGDEGTPVASFPVGFAVADGATIAVLDEQGEVLNLLE